MFPIILLAVLCFGLGAVLGAPFVPTHRQSVTTALDLANLIPGQHLLDLGAGSGTLVLAAARRGLTATGIEINPLLWLIGNLRIWPYRGRARVLLGNYWQMKWPEADAIYIFLIGHYMSRFSSALKKQIHHPTTIVSYTFEVPGLVADQTRDGVFIYRYKPT